MISGEGGKEEKYTEYMYIPYNLIVSKKYNLFVTTDTIDASIDINGIFFAFDIYLCRKLTFTA